MSNTAWCARAGTAVIGAVWLLSACGGGADAAAGDRATAVASAGTAGTGGTGSQDAAGNSGGGAGPVGQGGASEQAGSASGGAPSGSMGGQLAGAATAGAAGVAGSASGGAPNDGYLINAHFTAAALGAYRRASVEADFGVAAPWDNGLGAGRATVEQEGENKFLRVTYPNAVYGPANGGVQFVVDLGGDYDELYFAYRVRFQAGFGFNMGGKLPGLVGGTSPTGCAPDEGGFSARNMWRTGGAIVQYVYWPDQPNTCGDDRYYRSGNANVPLRPGSWQTIEHRVKMNTVGRNDGVLEGWVDGQRYLSESSRQWRKTGAFAIDALYFSTFFGGGSQPWASPKEQWADFDDLIVSETPITH